MESLISHECTGDRHKAICHMFNQPVECLCPPLPTHGHNISLCSPLGPSPYVFGLCDMIQFAGPRDAISAKRLMVFGAVFVCEYFVKMWAILLRSWGWNSFFFFDSLYIFGFFPLLHSYRKKNGLGMKARWWWCKTPYTGKNPKGTGVTGVALEPVTVCLLLDFWLRLWFWFWRELVTD